MTIELWVGAITLAASLVSLVSSFIKLSAAREDGRVHTVIETRTGNLRPISHATTADPHGAGIVFGASMVVALASALFLVGGLDDHPSRPRLQSLSVPGTPSHSTLTPQGSLVNKCGTMVPPNWHVQGCDQQPVRAPDRDNVPPNWRVVR
jgi:hypothetical protein